MAKVSIFAKRLGEARGRTGLSQMQLGINAGIHPFTASSRMNQYERDVCWPKLQIIIHIANALQVPLPYLFCDDEDLAILILKFPSLSKAQIKRLLAKLPKT
jgi:transcriptional regulator with XRE-family HTH domain